jgi:hypothetical protein
VVKGFLWEWKVLGIRDKNISVAEAEFLYLSPRSIDHQRGNVNTDYSAFAAHKLGGRNQDGAGPGGDVQYLRTWRNLNATRQPPSEM